MNVWQFEWIGILLAIIILLWVVWLWRKSKMQRPVIEEKPEAVPQAEEAARPPEVEGVAAPPIEVEIEKPKRIPIAKALASWFPLLRSKSKDRDQWEAVLIQSDLGPALSDELLDGLSHSQEEPEEYLRKKLWEWITPAEVSLTLPKPVKPWVVFIVGVNGSGKTTTLVKVANYFKMQGYSVGAVGADTFRKAAIEQLERGCQKVGVEFFSISGGEASEGADPAAVVFDGLRRFQDKDIILVDTSGRLHNKKNLMEELRKMRRVADKSIAGSPHDVWLIVDSTLGQNAVIQGKTFHEVAQLSGVILSKLDGLSRGGTVFQLYSELKTPIVFIGYG